MDPVQKYLQLFSSAAFAYLQKDKRTRTNPLQPTRQTGLTFCSFGLTVLLIYWGTFCALLSFWRITERRGSATGNSYKHS